MAGCRRLHSIRRVARRAIERGGLDAGQGNAVPTGALAPCTASAACTNCGAPLADPRPRFCGGCGQETSLRPPTLGEFLQQLGGAYFSTEGALWRTLRLLLTRPGELTRQYLAGRRKHYVLPLRLFLTISVVVLLAARLLASAAMDVPVEATLQRDSSPHGAITLGSGSAGLRDGKFYCEGLPPWICARLKRLIDVDPSRLPGVATQVGERLLANLGSTMFVLVPLFALTLKLAWVDRRLHYTEHLVHALHLHAFWFIGFGLMLSGLGWLSATVALALPLYTMRSLRRVYGGRWWSRWLRAAVVALLYLVAVTAVMSLLVLAVLLV